IPLETSLEDMRFDGDFTPEIVGLFDKYEFNSLRRYISHVKAETPAEGTTKEFEVRSVDVGEICSLARRSRAVGIKAEASGEGMRARISKLSLGVEGAVCQISGNQLDSVRALLEDDSVEKYGYDLKNISKLLSFVGIKLQGFWADIALMHYLINPERSHDIALLAKSFLGISLESGREIATSLFDEPQESEDTLDKEAAVLVELGKAVRKELGERERLYLEMEEPLAKVLAKMELAGVKVDMAQISSFADGLRQGLTELERNIRTEANAPDLNISSPKQVGDLLFDRLKLDPKAKKSGAKGQYPTDEATLQELNNPIADKILEFRAVKKLLSTYIEPFPSFVSPLDGRVHTTFNQALTATGRLSSSNPNLQNIPIRTERGKEIRKAFVPGTPDGVIVSADYSQIELRIMAHLSCDEHLVNAFRSGMDVHKATAAKIFKVPEDEVTREMRSMAKTANFGIMYGISSFGLAQRLQLGRKEAKKLIDDYFESFPAIRGFIDDSIAFARENGYVETLFGRRRYLPDINSKNATVRSLAERNAVNAPIQGTAADIIKLAMIRLDKRLSEEGLKSRMVLQIHDELLFDALPEEVGALEKIVVEEMENVLKLSVPLTVECSAGKNWLEAH
ncbi:MAG: DNA polymerase I, partial [Bacteroidales bacterium]|nr:DNA polymerase I [Bacteroidales bacterium]